MVKQRGYCLRCDGVGPLADFCPETMCAQSRYAFIPGEYYQEARERPKAFLDPLVGRRRDDYLLVDRLGKGGFAKVYLALQLPLLMKTAFKLLAPTEKGAFDPVRLRGRFEDEAKALAALSHPNIVRLLKYGASGAPVPAGSEVSELPNADITDVPYLVMEYVEGGQTLADELENRARRQRPFTAETAKHLLQQILGALDAAHSEGLIHADLKPDNVMLQEVIGDPYFVRVVDFGLTRILEEGIEDDTPLGAPLYIAPEQVECKPATAASDLYAVAVIAYQMLFGPDPFRGDTIEALIEQKMDAGYDPMAYVAKDSHDKRILEFFRRNLSPDPTHREASAAAMLTTLIPLVDLIAEPDGSAGELNEDVVMATEAETDGAQEKAVDPLASKRAAAALARAHERMREIEEEREALSLELIRLKITTDGGDE